MHQRKNGSTEYSTGNKTLPEKLATTHAEDGHKQDAKTDNEIQTGMKKERGTA